MMTMLQTSTPPSTASPEMTDTVIVAQYRSSHGHQVRIFRTEAGALRWKAEIAVEDYEIEFGEPIPQGQSIETTTDAYWASVEGSEFFEISTAAIEE